MSLFYFIGEREMYELKYGKRHTYYRKKINETPGGKNLNALERLAQNQYKAAVKAMEKLPAKFATEEMARDIDAKLEFAKQCKSIYDYASNLRIGLISNADAYEELKLQKDTFIASLLRKTEDLEKTVEKLRNANKILKGTIIHMEKEKELDGDKPMVLLGINDEFTFGKKHCGKKTIDVIMEDPSYVQWYMDTHKRFQLTKRAFDILETYLMAVDDGNPYDDDDRYDYGALGDIY